jgi:hypothetical protein
MPDGGESRTEAVPGAEIATADPRKFFGYLLSETHTVGRAAPPPARSERL